MNQKFTFFLLFAVPLFCMAQTPLARQYSYDASGNRTACAVINMSPPQAPPDSTKDQKLQVTSYELQEVEYEYFIEKIAQTEIKIYPNPTTEKITLAISRWENLQTGMFKLYSLNGQLLQEQLVHSLTTTISLIGMPKGVYILKVNVNGVTEDWKIIKN